MNEAQITIDSKECLICGTPHTNAFACNKCADRLDGDWNNRINFTPDYESMEYKKYYR